MTSLLMTKANEIETAVNDMLGIIVSFPLDSHVRGMSESEIIKVKAHYNWSMYPALLNSTKRSLQHVKDRLTIRARGDCKIKMAAFLEAVGLPTSLRFLGVLDLLPMKLMPHCTVNM